MKITVAGQKPHSHAAQDKVYYVLQGVGRLSLAPPPPH
jgi:oxalate decarboxylase/phosphoglucose isomerase-like protein (cupin superfamily)